MGEDFAILICPDHPTPISIMTHCADPVPYLIYNSKKDYPSSATCYDEEQAENTGIKIEKGHELIKKLFNC